MEEKGCKLTLIERSSADTMAVAVGTSSAGASQTAGETR
jgi:hypothetical protein